MVAIRPLIRLACDLDKFDMSYHKAKRHGLIMTDQQAEMMLMK